MSTKRRFPATFLVVRATAAALACALVSGACAHESATTTAPLPSFTEADVATWIPTRVSDREGWAHDVLDAIRATDKAPTTERVCAVLAVIEQESGFVADPPVHDLPRIVHDALAGKLAPLGPLSEAAVDAMLAMKMPDSDVAIGARVAKLRTERDLDRLFRDLSRGVRNEAPGSFAVASALSLLLGRGGLDELNPVTTAGSMQVKVSFAKDLAGDDARDDDVREQLYTRAGGVRAGTARLIGYAAHYDDVIYRFADFNSGIYASRNASVQHVIAQLMHTTLQLDGDLLSYDARGRPRDVETETLRALLAFGAQHGVSASTVKRDARLEKSAAFEQTTTWRALRAAWRDAHGVDAPYARMPDVALSSPKLSRPRTTTWYATNVRKRYDACRARAGS